MAQVFVSRMPACSSLGVSTNRRLTSSESDACDLLDALFDMLLLLGESSAPRGNSCDAAK